jgi:hypothetical protein
MPSFDVSRPFLNMRTKKFYRLIAEQFNMATAFLNNFLQLCLPVAPGAGALVSIAWQRPLRGLLSVMPAWGSCQFSSHIKN